MELCGQAYVKFEQRSLRIAANLKFSRKTHWEHCNSLGKMIRFTCEK